LSQRQNSLIKHSKLKIQNYLLKILLVHNFYGSSAPSGENTAFQAESGLLRKNGHTVIEFTRNSDEVRNLGSFGLLKGAFSTPWNPFSLKALKNILIKEKPDILHVHNFFPLISPSIFYATNDLDTPTVFTLHNYRIVCANAILLRNNSPCTECLDKQSILPSLKYKCYRESRMATLPLALSIKLHQVLGTWQRKVDAFISLTEFQKNKLIEAGLPAEKIHIKPHFYSSPPNPLPFNERGSKVVFIGRLGPEKGINVLLHAWKMWGEDAPDLEIIGDGPERHPLEKYSATNNLDNKISFLGQLPFPQTLDKLSRARLSILPTLCYEGFPMTVLEAFAMGVPVVASNIGSLPCIIENNKNGALFKAGDSEALCNALKEVWGNRENLEQMSTAARSTFEESFSTEINHKILMDIYQEASKRKKFTQQ